MRPLAVLGQVFLVVSKRVVPLPVLEEMQYSARRMAAQECLDHYIIHRSFPSASLLEESIAYAKSLNKSRDIIHKMKLETLEPILNTIDQTIACLESNSD